MNFEMRQELVPVRGGHVEISYFGERADVQLSLICASHPIDAFGPKTSALLSNVSGAAVVSVNPRGIGNSSNAQATSDELVQVIDDLEAVRRHLRAKTWTFWGLSGGGWLGQLYAHRYPQSLSSVILESVCACLRERAADPECVLSPQFPAWREPLAALGLLDFAPSAACTRDQLEWVAGPGIGATLRRKAGPAVLVSPIPASPPMQRMLPLFFQLDTRAWLKSIAIPTLVICGTADPVLPLRHARALHEALANSELLVVEGAGHVPVTESREEVAAAVRDFLLRHSLNAGAVHE